MSIRFKCPSCKKPLAVKDQLAGKRAPCPVCKKPLVIPAPLARPADLEDFAAAALADEPVQAPKEDTAKPIEFTCAYCDELVKVPAEFAGKQHPCPSCKHIVKVPLPKEDKPKDWRDINKKGPTAALMNLPEQLDGAWGTEIKGKVGTAALEEAGALPEIEVESVGVGGWIRRGAITAAVVGVVALLVVAGMRNRRHKQEKNAIEAAREFAKSVEKDPKKRLPGVLAAEIDRAEGILLLRLDKLEAARKSFVVARLKCDDGNKDNTLDHDFFLIDLARSQFDLSGTEDQFRQKVRYEWKDELRKEILQTLQKIQSTEAKVIAIRELASDLSARGNKEFATSLAAGLNNPVKGEANKGASIQAQVMALAFAYGNPKKGTKLDLPDLATQKGPLELPARLAYAEGYARKGDLEEAKKIALSPAVTPLHQAEALIGIASVLVSEKTTADSPDRASAVITDAIKFLANQKNPPTWTTFQCCRAALRIPAQTAEAKQLADKLPANFKRRIQLEWFQLQLEKSDEKSCKDLMAPFAEAENPTRALAWLALGRRFGSACPVPDTETEDPTPRLFANIGKALASQPQDTRK